jgi:hypothetical protein
MQLQEQKQRELDFHLKVQRASSRYDR